MSKSARIQEKAEDFIYEKIVRTLMLTSKLGRQSVLGKSDSGVNFEHMYGNKAEGSNWLGMLVDRILLNLPSVKATRNRKNNIKLILKNEIKNHILQERKTRILDVGSGTARYLLELRHHYSDMQMEGLCLDCDRDSIKLAKKLYGHSRGSKSHIRFARMNVNRADRLKAFGSTRHWVPNVIIASGFIYYLNDDQVRNTFEQMGKTLAKDGLLIVSNIVSSKSQKLMEKVCTTQSDQAWVLHYRDPDKIRRLLFDAGFRDIVIGRDPWGMYNVCTARRP